MTPTFTNDLFVFLDGLTQGKVKGVKAVDKKGTSARCDGLRKRLNGAQTWTLLQGDRQSQGIRSVVSLL